MIIRVFYVGLDNGAVADAAELLARQYDMLPVYWSGAAGEEKAIKSRFPNVFFHNVFDAVYGGGMPQAFEGLWPIRQLSSDVLEEYAVVEATVWEMLLTRADPEGGFSYYEFSHYYHHYLANALALVKELKPDLWVSRSSPHMMYDLVLMAVFKAKGLPCCILHDTVVPGRVLAVDNLTDATDMVKTKLGNMCLNDRAISNTTQNYLLRVRGAADLGQPYTSTLYFGGVENSYHSEQKIAARLKRKCWNQRKLILIEQMYSWFGRPAKPPVHYYKEPGVCWEGSYSTRLSWLRVYKRIVKRQRRLLRQYRALSTYPKLGERYIYVPLHWQPECTSVPDGGRLSDQILFVKMLNSVLPNDVVIYVKENMAQFEWHRGSFARHAWYYDEMNSVDSVRLIKTDVESFSLIDNSLCVATLTGTAGFEAIARGKPAMVGGDLVWYKDAPGVFSVKSADQMSLAFERIEAGLVFGGQALEGFLSAYEAATYRCVTDENKVEYLGLDRGGNIRELAQAILGRHKFSVQSNNPEN